MLPLLSSTIYLVMRSLNVVDAYPVNMTITSLPTSDISFSILADSVNTTASSQRCDNIDNCRTLDSIVQSCLVTILACAWFAVHRNIPPPKQIPSHHPKFYVRWPTWVWRTVSDQKVSLMVFLVAFSAPEIILAWAMRQSVLASELAGKLEKARLKAIEARTAKEDAAEITRRVEGQLSLDRSTPTRTESERIELINLRSNSFKSDAVCDKCDGRGCECDLFAAAKRVAKADECWTVLHAFFVAMGGFEFYNEDGLLYTLSPANVLELVACGHLFPPTADEISDRSKGDWLSKGVAIGQTVWFVVQFIVRRAGGLPVTRLEVMTLAYTVVTVAMYRVWWHKPLNVSCAVRVPEEEVEEEEVLAYNSIWEAVGIYMLGWQDEYVDLRKRKGVPTFWAGKPGTYDVTQADGGVVVVGMAFGAVHCIAWHSDFQSHLEQELWRSSAIAIIAVPAALFSVSGMVLGAALPAGMPMSRMAHESYQAAYNPKVVNMFLLGVLCTPVIIIYITARLILIILSFTSLSGLPFAAYQTVQWTTFMPHI